MIKHMNNETCVTGNNYQNHFVSNRHHRWTQSANSVQYCANKIVWLRKERAPRLRMQDNSNTNYHTKQWVTQSLRNTYYHLQATTYLQYIVSHIELYQLSKLNNRYNRIYLLNLNEFLKPTDYKQKQIPQTDPNVADTNTPEKILKRSAPITNTNTWQKSFS